MLPPGPGFKGITKHWDVTDQCWEILCRLLVLQGVLCHHPTFRKHSTPWRWTCQMSSWPNPAASHWIWKIGLQLEMSCLTYPGKRREGGGKVLFCSFLSQGRLASPVTLWGPSQGHPAQCWVHNVSVHPEYGFGTCWHSSWVWRWHAYRCCMRRIDVWVNPTFLVIIEANEGIPPAETAFHAILVVSVAVDLPPPPRSPHLTAVAPPLPPTPLTRSRRFPRHYGWGREMQDAMIQDALYKKLFNKLTLAPSHVRGQRCLRFLQGCHQSP